MEPTAHEASAEAVEAARVAAEAVEAARNKQVEQIANASDERTAKVLESALRHIFGEGERQKKFIDVSRIPFICDNIHNIAKDISDIKQAMEDAKEKADERYVNQDQFVPVKTIVYGLVSLILTGVVGAILALIISKP